LILDGLSIVFIWFFVALVVEFPVCGLYFHDFLQDFRGSALGASGACFVALTMVCSECAVVERRLWLIFWLPRKPGIAAFFQLVIPIKIIEIEVS